MKEESRELELRRRLTSALDGKSVLVFTMLLIFGVYKAYWLWLAMCYSACWRYVQFERLMGVCVVGRIRLSERRCGVGEN